MARRSVARPACACPGASAVVGGQVRHAHRVHAWQVSNVLQVLKSSLLTLLKLLLMLLH